MQLDLAKQHALNILEKSLPDYLTYHCIGHTIDVYNEAERIAKAEKVDSRDDLTIVLTAAAYHDIGFVVSELNHEQQSSIIAMNDLPQFEYNDLQINKICELIMATKIPQTPNSHLAEILCDADLDYLGRTDFETISATLYDEFLYRKIVTDVVAWNKIQINFFNSHHYFTKTNYQLRNLQKAINLKKIIETVNAYG
ncbi:MAG: HD domain-containing protein [Flavobacteriales bacterium]|nr:HD domain-containing protein [Flavobacteriales bacterium]